MGEKEDPISYVSWREGIGSGNGGHLPRRTRNEVASAQHDIMVNGTYISKLKDALNVNYILRAIVVL